jgi:hypothetical protein
MQIAQGQRWCVAGRESWIALLENGDGVGRFSAVIPKLRQQQRVTVHRDALYLYSKSYRSRTSAMRTETINRLFGTSEKLVSQGLQKYFLIYDGAK